jgi:hypothetical protein
MPSRGGGKERMKGPRWARMPVNWAGSKCLGRTEKETEWLRFHAPQAPGNSHCTPTVSNKDSSSPYEGVSAGLRAR